VKAPRRPPLDACDTEADRVFTVSVDWDAAQIMLRALPTGAGGGASLVPVPGVELVFDRASGRLSQLLVGVADRGGVTEPSGAAISYVRTIFGDAAAAGLRQIPYLAVPHVMLRAAPDTAAALSRLSRLHAARLTSPVQSSPLWAVEAARLTRQAAGPTPGTQHCGGAWRAVIDMLMADPPPAGPVQDAEPRRSGRWTDGWLDPALAPAGVFRHGLSPESDLIVRDAGATLVVEAMLADPADVRAFGRCRVRLVDSGARRVVATARFRSRGQCARAALQVPAGLSAAAPYWIEVVDDERRPVQGTRLRRVRRALRWADAALRAETCPAGLAPWLTAGQWAELAVRAWDQCRADWEAAGDADRAYLAAAHRAVLAGEATSAQPLPAPPSSWSARLAHRDVHPAPPFLAEESGRPLCPPLGGFLDHHDNPPVVTGRATSDEVRGAVPDDGQRGGADVIRFQEAGNGLGTPLRKGNVVSRGSRHRGVPVDHRGDAGPPQPGEQRRQDTRGGGE